jgi:hypothetical protein
MILILLSYTNLGTETVKVICFEFCLMLIPVTLPKQILVVNDGIWSNSKSLREIEN